MVIARVLLAFIDLGALRLVNSDCIVTHQPPTPWAVNRRGREEGREEEEREGREGGEGGGEGGRREREGERWCNTCANCVLQMKKMSSLPRPKRPLLRRSGVRQRRGIVCISVITSIRNRRAAGPAHRQTHQLISSRFH